MPNATSYKPSSPAETLLPGKKRQPRALILVLILLIAGWLVAYALTLWSLRQTTLENGLAESASLARSFERHLTQTLEMIEMASLSVAPEQDIRHAKHPFSAQLKLLLNQAPYLRSISLVNPEGIIIASSLQDNVGTPLPPIDFYPDAPQDTPLLRIGLPLRGRDLYNAEIPGLTQPLAADEAFFLPVIRPAPGKNAGLRIVATLNPDYFLLHFQQLMPSTAGFVQVLRHDGRLLISSWPQDNPSAPEPAGAVHQQLASADFGEMAQSLDGGFEVLTGYRTSSHFPVVVAIHLNRAHVLQRWQSESRRLSLIVFPILLALTAAILMIWRRQKRLEEKERELLEQRLLAASLFEATSDGVLITTPDGQIITSNPAYERISGYSADEMRGRNPRMLSSGLHDQAFFQTLWQAVESTGHWQGEIVNRHKDGHFFHNLLTINAVSGPDGRTHHLIGVATDITQLKANEAELKSARDRAESASHAKSVFLGTMSHELRTPMHGVLGMTELLLRSPMGERQTYQLKVIRSSAQRLLGILEQLLDYTDFEAHGITLSISGFDPRQLLSDLLAEFAPQAAHKSLQLKCTFAPDAPASILGDPLRVKQTLANLLSNAVKFTESGSIDVSLSLDPATGLNIAVSDTGIGIATERQNQIFEAFTQIEDSANRRFGGLGLGLALAYRLAHAMGGKLSVNSVPGQGSCFTLNLPLLPPPKVG